jgi:glutamate-1-semialdehyde 2,1-aminomutase
VPKDFVKHTLSLPYNDIDCIKKVMESKGNEIACIIVEPVAGNMGLIPPVEGFLETLRETTAKTGSILIFDEVMTGFRVAYGGAQSLYKMSPDLTCLAKIIGGGLPVGAYGGRKDIMSFIAPQGPVYQAGTLSGNPLAMAAGIAALNQLKVAGFYDSLEIISSHLEKGLRNIADKHSINVTVQRVGSMLCMFFTNRKVNNYEDAKTSDLVLFSKFYKGMLEQGIYLAPSQFESLFVSSAHTMEEIDFTIEATDRVLCKI